MDEPTVGLDPITADETRKLLIALNRDLNKTILFTSHNMLEVEKLCQRVAIMHKGKLIADERPEVLSRLHREAEGIDLQLESERPLEDLRKAVEGLPQVVSVLDARGVGTSFTLQLRVKNEGEAIYELPGELRKMGIGVSGISRSKLSLEEVFLRLTKT
jgi:ABC-2 type transport system ATP-binding protein